MPHVRGKRRDQAIQVPALPEPAGKAMHRERRSRSVQELLGHKTIAMTVRYSHLAPTHLHEAVERLTAKPTDTEHSEGNTKAHGAAA